MMLLVVSRQQKWHSWAEKDVEMEQAFRHTYVTNLARAAHANMFLSPLFAQTFAGVTQTTVELYNTDGSQGAARGAGIGAGIYKDIDQAFVGLEPVKTIEPEDKLANAYRNAYDSWKKVLDYELEKAQ